MLNLRERIVEMVEKLLPALVLYRLPKTYGMAFELVPPHQQQIAVVVLEAASQFMALVARHARDYALRIRECLLEARCLVSTDVENCDLENHI